MAELRELLLTPPGLWIGVAIVIILLLPALKALVWRLFGFEARLQTILSQTKSSEVRTGKLVETLAPLLNDFPVDITKPGTSTIFLGQPVDFVHFDPESGVTFIEVKSNAAALSASQRQIRAAIEAGNVHWAELRLRADDPAPREVRASSSKRRAG